MTRRDEHRGYDEDPLAERPSPQKADAEMTLREATPALGPSASQTSAPFQVTGAPIVAGVVLVLVALLVGALSGIDPFIALALVGAVLVGALAFLAPVTHLVLLLLVTVIVPFGVQNRAGLGIGPGLLLADVLLLTGLLRASIVLLKTRLSPRQLVVGAAMLTFILLVALQAVHGLQLNRGASQVGFEFRVLLGFGAVFIAMPILSDADGRKRLGAGLMIAALILGLWGLVQWTLNIEEIDESGAGVRAGVRLTSAGTGQIQGGLYAFPVAVLVAFAVLVSGRIRSIPVRVLLVSALTLNAVSLLLTYERTFWVATVLGLGFVILKAGRAQRLGAAIRIGIAGVLLLVALSVLSPTELTAARERLLSLGQYQSDDSVRIRLLESRLIADEIKEQPLSGSGLGATVYYGRPWQQVAPLSTWYVHNGYLWLAWKVGLAAAFLLFLLLGWAVIARGRARQEPVFDAIRMGSQAALLVLLISSVTFPAFNALAITATMGVLLAICFAAPTLRNTAALS